MHVVPFRRKRENKTDYKTRLGLVKSKETRFVVRKSLKHMVVQAISYEPAGDKVHFTVSSSQLKKLGWNYSTSNIPASYLVGVLAGKKAKDLKIKSGILDIGLQASIKGSRLYAALKGIVDAGVEIPISEEIFPSADRLNGKHIASFKKAANIDKDMIQVKNKILA
jgi:large subunit ribosomal protein L18